MSRPASFDTTSWSLILTAAAGGGDAGVEALADICNRYWTPVYSFIRSRGYEHEEAEDLTQSFFHALVEKQFLRQADRHRGRFRSFLLAAVRNFVSNERDRQLSVKRGGRQSHVVMESVPGVPDTKPSPEQVFERKWALAILERTILQLRAEAQEQGRTNVDQLLPFLSGDADPSAYREIAAANGTTEGAVRVAVHRLRRRFGYHLRRQIADTVSSSDVDAEIRFLISSLGAS